MDSSYNPTLDELQELLEAVDDASRPEHVKIAAALLAGCSPVLARATEPGEQARRATQTRLGLIAMKASAPESTPVLDELTVNAMLQGREDEQFLALRRSGRTQGRSRV